LKGDTVTDTSTADRTAVTEAGLHPLLANRWSPRGFDPEYRISDADLAALLEAARWTPSCANSQPWRFLVARRGESGVDRLAAHLLPGNASWAPTASVLLAILATTVDEKGEPLPLAQYDAGQAGAHLSVQATALDLVVHQMAGFDADGLRAEFNLPDTLKPMAMVAIGRWDPEAPLPDYLREREFAPRRRKPLSDLILPI
jgi:nitroreductase